MPGVVTSRRDWRDLWEALLLEEWQAILNEYLPDNKWHIKGSHIVGCCPFHNDSTPSFNISPEKGFAYCFGCQKYINNPLALLSAAGKKPIYHVLRDLKNTYHLTFTDADVKNINKTEENNRIKAALYTVCNKALCDAIANPADYAAPLIEWLKLRKVPLDVLFACPVGILPPREVMHAYLEKQGNADLYEQVFNYLEACYAVTPQHKKYEGWMMFFYFINPTTIGGIKLREPTQHTKSFHFIDDPMQPEQGMFGLNMFPEVRVDFENRFVHVVEGEFDALALITRQLATGDNDIFTVASGGSMVDTLDFLVKDIGFKGIRLIPDNDLGGERRVKNWLKSNQSPIEVFVWPAVAAKDPDALITQDASSIEIFRKQENYKKALNWVQDYYEKKVSTYPPEETGKRIEQAIECGTWLTNQIDKDVFIAWLSEKHNLPSGSFEKLIRQTSEENEFLHQLEHLLKKTYMFLSADSTDKGHVEIRAWSKRRRQLVNLIRGMRGLRASLELDTGKFDDFVEQEIGIPEYIKTTTRKGQSVNRPSSYIMAELMTHAENALANIAYQLPSSSHFETVGQGVHYLKNGENYEVYVINGNKFFRGKLTEEGGVDYVEFDAPFNDTYIFKASNTPWSNYIKRLEDLQPNGINAAELYKKIHRIVSTLWKFKNHDLDAMFLTGLIMYFPVASIFKHMVFTDITGPTHSGKSSFMQLVSGSSEMQYKLCEATVLLENYSSAGVRQFMANNRLCLLLDEFEDRDSGLTTDPKTRAVREILELVRSGASGASFVRGTAGGEAVTGKINFPLLVGGIYTMQQVQDVNRFVHIETKQIKGWKFPLAAVREMYTLEELQDLQRQVTLCFLPRLGELAVCYEELRNEFLDKKNLAPEVMDRQLRNYLPVAAILKYIKEDYKEFVKEFSREKAKQLEALGGTVQFYEQIWSTILAVPHAFRLPSGDLTTGSIISMLAMGNGNAINAIDIGVYYIMSKNWLVINWNQIVDGLLNGSTLFKGYKNAKKLQALANEHEAVIPIDTILPTLIEELQRISKFALSPKDLSVLDLNKVLPQLWQHSETASPFDFVAEEKEGKIDV